MQTEEGEGEPEEDGSEAPSGNELNPASTVDGPSDTGLARLDAGKEEDTTSVEDKIETVAGAIGSQDEQTEDSKVRFTALHHGFTPFESIRQWKVLGKSCNCEEGTCKYSQRLCSFRKSCFLETMLHS